MLILAGIAAAGAAIFLSAGSQPATACNRTAGCAMDALQEGHDMMQDGRAAENMRAAQENINAFKRQQAADEAAIRARSARK
ncbi:hypothetical protein FQV39_12995 [Bosea sp. F3-2]|uniref:hypothetical protein n=1 Tax=Bosea sp. F3-2 TaxID=2599640 RepID=UPI0011EC55D0|nr:hypothetical protein [Bosea sp. F3-2]QEL23390.1 hypothetical protein FQV39_12995 [Bosea sp. F3-2]